MNNQELYHYGVPGMKWGVSRANRTSSGGNRKRSSSKTKRSKTTKEKVASGKNFVSKIDKQKVAKIVASSAALAGSALWVASALIPGASGTLNAARAITGLTSAIATTDLGNQLGIGQKSSSTHKGKR